jgi:hypothetical protein
VVAAEAEEACSTAASPASSTTGRFALEVATVLRRPEAAEMVVEEQAEAAG